MKTNTIAISPEAVSFLVGILGNVMDGLCIPDKDRHLAKELYDTFAPLACTNAKTKHKGYFTSNYILTNPNNDCFTLTDTTTQQ